MTAKIKTIALFGTSADPPTRGHQQILTWLSQRYDLVVVWAADNPFKQHGANLAQRHQMLEILIAEIDTSKDNIELNTQISDRRTINTLHRAQAIWPEAKFTLIIGSDLIGQVQTWYHGKELLSQVELLVIPRPGYDTDEKVVEQLSKLTEVAIAEIQPAEVSSSQYRQQQDQDILTPGIQTYIQTHQLYQSNSAEDKGFKSSSKS